MNRQALVNHTGFVAQILFGGFVLARLVSARFVLARVVLARVVLAWLVVAVISFAGPTQALQLHYALDRETELLSCDSLANTGKHIEARECFQRLLSVDNSPEASIENSTGIKAAAAQALGNFKLANRLYREAADIEYPARNKTRWGELYLYAHQPGEAVDLFREALQHEPEYLPAKLGLATAQARQFEGRVRESLTEILRTQPDSFHATLLFARMELELQRTEPARLLLKRAEELATEQNLPPLEIYALYASADLLEGITDSPWTQKALDINPRYGDIYSIPSHFYIITYRYREAVDLYRKATKIEPELADAQSNLGINLLRTNDIYGARYHLERAYELDPFNTETVNTLKLLDDLDKMRVSYADIQAEDSRPGDEPIGRALIRLDLDSVDALEPYVVELTTRAVQQFTKRYDFNLKKPVVVELYHNHDDFGVRTVSTPGVGLLGVTFGYVLAMDSPKARSTADFHWGSTLWHELAHVFTLEAANHLLPRWFSEGISVYEEWNTGPLTSRELPIQVLQMFSEQKFLPITSLDRGFVRPSYEGQVTVSYMQAGLICDFISQRWGHEALVVMLKQFAKGASTEAALLEAIEITGSEFDQIFSSHIASAYETILGNLNSWNQLGQILANAVRRSETELSGRWSEIETMAEKRIDLYPQYIGRGNAYLPLARAQKALGKTMASLDTKWEWFQRGGSVPEVMVELASDLRLAGRDENAFAVLEALNWVMPYLGDEHRQLANWYLDSGRYLEAVREFDAYLGVRPDEASTALLGKARAYHAQQDHAQAKRNVLLSLEQAPFYRDAQHLLLELTSGE